MLEGRAKNPGPCRMGSGEQVRGLGCVPHEDQAEPPGGQPTNSATETRADS